MSCTNIITSGITKDCATVNAAIGVDKDLILVNYEDFDYKKTFDPLNRETSGSNIKGLKEIFLKIGTEQHIFEGTDYSVIPSIIPEVREDGSGTWFSSTKPLSHCTISTGAGTCSTVSWASSQRPAS